MYPEIIKGNALYDIDHCTGFAFITYVQDIAVDKITFKPVTQHLINDVQVRPYDGIFIPVLDTPFGKPFHIFPGHCKIFFQSKD